MHNLEQKVLVCPQMLDVKLDLVEVEYLFVHFDFSQTFFNFDELLTPTTYRVLKRLF